MEWTRVLQYLREGENLSTKFIAVVNNDQDIGPTICGMTNTIGGKIFIGMDPHNFHLNGTTIDESWIHQLILSFFSPQLKLQVEIVIKNDKRIIYICVPQVQNKPYTYRDVCYVMDPQGVRKATKEEEHDFTAQQQDDSPMMQVPSHEHPTTIVDTIEEEYTNPFELAAKTKTIPPEPEKNIDNSSVQSLPNVKLVSHHSDADEENVEMDVTMISDELIDLESESDSKNLASPLTSDSIGSTEIESKVVLEAPEFKPPSNVVTYKPESIKQKKEAQLNDRQKKALYFLNTEPFIKNKKYRELFDVSHKTAHLELVDLMGKGFIYQEGSGRSTCYRKF